MERLKIKDLKTGPLNTARCGQTLTDESLVRMISGVWVFSDAETSSSFVRIGAVAEDEFYYISDEDGSLTARYAEKFDMLRSYDVSEEIENRKDKRNAFTEPFVLDSQIWDLVESMKSRISKE